MLHELTVINKRTITNNNIKVKTNETMSEGPVEKQPLPTPDASHANRINVFKKCAVKMIIIKRTTTHQAFSRELIKTSLSDGQFKAMRAYFSSVHDKETGPYGGEITTE